MLSPEKSKSLESWIWDAVCSIRGAKDAPKYKDYILPLIVTKRQCDVFDDEINRIAKEVGSRKKAFQPTKAEIGVRGTQISVLDFNSGEFAIIKIQVGLNSHTWPPKRLEGGST